MSPLFKCNNVSEPLISASSTSNSCPFSPSSISEDLNPIFKPSSVSLDISKLTEDGLKIGLRSSDIELGENGHEFEVELAEISGSETLLHLKRGDTKIIVSIEEVLNFKIHDKVKINFKIDRAYAFHADGKLASSPFGGLNG